MLQQASSLMSAGDDHILSSIQAKRMIMISRVMRMIMIRRVMRTNIMIRRMRKMMMRMIMIKGVMRVMMTIIDPENCMNDNGNDEL